MPRNSKWLREDLIDELSPMLTRIILFALLTYAGTKVVSLVRRYISSADEDATLRDSTVPTEYKEMVKDPVCGVYILADDAVRLNSRKGVVHFCSEACRRRYVEDKG